jgi:hypothetical protein
MSEVITALTWAYQLTKSKIPDRKKVRHLVMNGIKNFKLGKPSKAGDDLVKSLKKDFEFIGFSPNIMYIKEDGPKKHTEVQWVHPFSVPTLLFKNKKLPYLVLVNPNLDFNDSRLRKIDQNLSLEELQGVLGITG